MTVNKKFDSIIFSIKLTQYDFKVGNALVYLISATYSAALRNLSYSNKNLRNFNDFWNFSNDFETA